MIPSRWFARPPAGNLFAVAPAFFPGGCAAESGPGVVEHNPLEVDPPGLKDLRVEPTVVGDSIVHDLPGIL